MQGWSSSAGCGSPSPGAGALTEAKIHLQWKKTSVSPGQWPAAPKMLKRVPSGGTPCSSLPCFRRAGGTFYLRRWKNGDSRCHFRRTSSLQPLLLDPLWQFWGILETEKEKGFGVLVLRHCGAPPPSGQGEGEGPLLSRPCPPRAPAAARTQALAEFRLWIFAEVFFGPNTALGKDSSPLALEKTPVRFNLSFA